MDSSVLPEMVSAPLSESVQVFAHQHGLVETLATAIQFARDCFALQTLEVVVRQDDENAEEWLSIRITVRGKVDEALQSYQQYVRMWVESVSWPKRGLIRLSYTLA